MLFSAIILMAVPAMQDPPIAPRPPWLTRDFIESCEAGVNEHLQNQFGESWEGNIDLTTSGTNGSHVEGSNTTTVRVTSDGSSGAVAYAEPPTLKIYVCYTGIRSLFGPNVDDISPEVARLIMELILAHELQHIPFVCPGEPMGKPGKPRSKDPDNTPDSCAHLEMFLEDAARARDLACNSALLAELTIEESCELFDAACALYRLTQDLANTPGNTGNTCPGVPPGPTIIPDCVCCENGGPTMCNPNVNNIEVFEYGEVSIQFQQGQPGQGE